MIMVYLTRLVPAFAVVAALAGPAIAAPKAVVLVACQTHEETQEKADRDLLRKMPRDIKSPEAATMLPQLESALAHAPDRPPLPEICGDAINVYDRSLTPVGEQAEAIALYVKDHPDLAGKTIVRKPRLPYTSLAFWTSELKAQAGDLDGALKAADKGIANDPDDPLMTSHKASVLYKLKRNDEAVALIDAYLAAHGDDPDLERSSRVSLLSRKLLSLHALNRRDDMVAVEKEIDNYQ